MSENEWNAWFIDTSNPLNWNTWHSMLYYIINWEEKVISFVPDSFDNWLYHRNNWSFIEWKMEINSALYYIQNKEDSVVFIEYKYVDIEAINIWFDEEKKNQPEYHTLKNNCSTEVGKALEAWWINIPTPIDSPWHLHFWLEQHLQREKEIEFFKSLF